MTEDARKPVQVSCDIPNGIALQLARPMDDGTGHTQMRRYGDVVTLNGPRSLRAEQGADNSPEINDVDPEFWAAWLEQNAANPLVVNQRIRAVGERSDPAPEPAKDDPQEHPETELPESTGAEG